MNTLNRRINEKVKDKFPELNIEIRINEWNIATVAYRCFLFLICADRFCSCARMDCWMKTNVTFF